MRPEREGGLECACFSKTAVLFTFALFLIDFFFGIRTTWLATAIMTTLKENCSSKFKMDLDPACFQLDGATIIIIDYDILKPFWKKTLSEKVIHYRFTVLYIQ